jgi:hypothetical protein
MKKLHHYILSYVFHKGNTQVFGDTDFWVREGKLTLDILNFKRADMEKDFDAQKVIILGIYHLGKDVPLNDN